MSGSLSLCGVANPKAATQPIVHDWEHGWSRDWLQCHCWENPGRLVDTHQFCHIYTKCLCSYVIWLSAILLCDVMCHWWPRVLTPYCTAFRCTVHRLDVAISLKIRVLGKKLDTGFQQFMRILLTRWLFSKQRYKRQRVAVVPKVETCTIYRIVNRTIQHNTTPILLKGYCIPPSTWHFESTSRVSHSEAYVLLINCQVSNAQIVWCLLVKTTYHIHINIYIYINRYVWCMWIYFRHNIYIYIYTHIRIQHYRLVAFSQRLAFIHKPGGFFYDILASFQTVDVHLDCGFYYDGLSPHQSHAGRFM